MSISKFMMTSAVLVAASVAAVPMSAFAASDINNSKDCAYEGGTMTNVKGSDYCLVQIRPKEYESDEYDGNQLGVVNCPGSKLNDGLFCMYPVTQKKSGVTSVSSLLSVVGGQSTNSSLKEKAGTALLKNKMFGGKKSTQDVLVDVAKKEAKDRAKEAAKKALGGK